MKSTRALGLGILAGAAAGIAIGRRISQPPKMPGLAIFRRALAEERGEGEAAALVEVQQQPGLAWRVIRLMNHCLAGTVKPWQRRGDLILALTTTGRFTGRPHVTPLQYERVNGLIYVAAARGQQADWFRNIVANPEVEVEMGGGRFVAQAEPITDPSRIADYLELRLRRHPRMIRAMLLLHGLPPRADRAQLEQLSEKLALVALPIHTS